MLTLISFFFFFFSFLGPMQRCRIYQRNMCPDRRQQVDNSFLGEIKSAPGKAQEAYSE